MRDIWRSTWYSRGLICSSSRTDSITKSRATSICCSPLILLFSCKTLQRPFSFFSFLQCQWEQFDLANFLSISTTPFESVTQTSQSSIFKKSCSFTWRLSFYSDNIYRGCSASKLDSRIVSSPRYREFDDNSVFSSTVFPSSRYNDHVSHVIDCTFLSPWSQRSIIFECLMIAFFRATQRIVFSWSKKKSLLQPIVPSLDWIDDCFALLLSGENDRSCVSENPFG